MRELFAVAAAFAVIPLLSRKKVSIDISICIAGVIMAILGGMGPVGIGRTIYTKFTDVLVLQQLIVIAEISILGVLMKQYGIMDRMIGALTKLVGSPKIIIMSIPALIGMLNVPGGAIISAPFVKDLGDRQGVDAPTCAAINLVFRHISMHVMPYTTAFLLVASLVPQVSIYRLVGLNAIFVAAYVLTGYLLYIRNIPGKTSGTGFDIKNVGRLILYTSPIHAAIILNAVTGLPFYLAMLLNLLMAFLLGPRQGFLRDLVKAFNGRVMLSLVGVYFIQAVISQFADLTAFFAAIFGNPSTILLGIILTSFFFGFTTGFQPTAVGLVLPLLAAAPLSPGQLLMFIHFTFCWGFLGYFFSPLHLCQLFTCEFMGVGTKALYQKYKFLFLSLVIFLLLEYFAMQMIIR